MATDPANPLYDWTQLDTAVRNATAAGLTPLITVTNSPKWARAPGCTEEVICYPFPQDYADFATAVARRYSGSFDPGTGTLPHVRYWQAWGEANLFLFFLPQFEGGQKVSPDNYRNLLNPFSAMVKSVDPTNQVISAGLAPLNVCGSGPLDFMRRLLCMQGRKHPKPEPGCDATAPSTSRRPIPIRPAGQRKSRRSRRRDDRQSAEDEQLVNAGKRAGKIETDSSSVPLWVTEFSWDSKPPDPGGLKMRIFAPGID